MSVFTTVSHDELVGFLSEYNVGALMEHTGIAEGIENTNYFVRTSSNRFVLTLFERTPEADLPFFLSVMDAVSRAGLPGAAPVRRKDGNLLGRLNERPASLVTRLHGSGIVVPNAAQTAQLGATLAQLHLALQGFEKTRPNDRGLAWMQAMAAKVHPQLPAEQAALLQDELTIQSAASWQGLPHGVIHADLFRDNALFEEDRLSGLIDFYYACHDAWLLDLAVSFNDWVLITGHAPSGPVAQALLQAYQSARPLQAAEQALWPIALRRAALRFWLSRLEDWHFPRDGELTYRKDPADFEQLLCWHRAHTVPL